jgi:hypothetical protein
MHLKHMSRRTEAYQPSCILRFIRFHGKRQPHAMGIEEIRAYWSYLASDKNVAASTQNRALPALLCQETFRSSLSAIQTFITD